MDPRTMVGEGDGGPQAGQAHWPATRRLTALLLGAWCVVTFVLAYFARELHFHVFGWPFSFWLGAQGGLVVYVAITWAYAHGMDRVERGASSGAPPA
jgi:putative solute:sodium symporter small subunit